MQGNRTGKETSQTQTEVSEKVLAMFIQNSSKDCSLEESPIEENCSVCFSHWLGAAWTERDVGIYAAVFQNWGSWSHLANCTPHNTFFLDKRSDECKYLHGCHIHSLEDFQIGMQSK